MVSADFHVGEATQTITLTVRGLRGFGVRLWIARQLFALGARIAGLGMKFEDDASR